MHPSKPPLRARLIAERRALDPDELARGSEAIVRRVLELPEFATQPAGHDGPDAEPGPDSAEPSVDARSAGPRVVTLYQPMKGELAIEPLWRALEARGVDCLFPRVVHGNKVLAFGPADSLRAGVLGIREPAPGSERPLDSIDAFILPGVAFDETGGRMGHGAGYYDATLAAAPRALRIGACLDRFLLPELPRESHDQPIDLLVTPTRTLRFPPRGI